MTQWPSQEELQEARNSVMLEVLDLISHYDLKSNSTVSLTLDLLRIVDSLDPYCDD